MAGFSKRQFQPARLAGYLQVFVVGLFLSVFLLAPLIFTLTTGFRVDGHGAFTIANFRQIFSDPGLRAGLVNSGAIALATTLLCALLAMPLAMLTLRYEFPFKKWFSALVLIPLILPPFVGAIGMRAVLGRMGALNSLLGTDWDILGNGRFWGVVIVEALHLYPVLYLNLAAALANIEPAMEDAARGLGATRWVRFRRITLPLARPGLVAGMTIVLIWSFTELGTPLMFNYNEVTPVQIFARIKEIESSPIPYALTTVMLVAAVALYGVGRAVLGRAPAISTTKASVVALTRPLTGWRGGAAAAFCALIALLAMLPHLGVVLASLTGVGSWYRSVLPQHWTFEHYGNALSHDLAMGSMINSLKYALCATLLTALLGLAVGWITVRSSIPGRKALDACAMLPLAVPGLVMAFGLVALTLHAPFTWSEETAPTGLKWLVPFFSSFDVLGPAANPFLLLVIAYAVRRLPYMVRATAAGLEQSSPAFEEAARNLGAGPLTTMRRITVPIIAANLIAGALLVFAFSMLEVSDSLLLAQREAHFPLTKAIYTFNERLGDGQYIASAMGVWGMALLAVTLISAALLMGRRMGTMFRA